MATAAAMARGRRDAHRATGAGLDGLAQRDVLARLAECERKLDLLWSSSVGGELRNLALRREQRVVESERERGTAVERAKLTDRRRELFEDFLRARVAFAPGLTTTVLALDAAYQGWCDEHKILPSSPLRMTADELAAALAEVGEVVPAGIRCPGYRGQGDFRQPGFEGCGVCPEGQTPDDVVRELLLATEQQQQERADRRADHAAEAAREDRALQTKIDRDAGLAALGRQARSAK